MGLNLCMEHTSTVLCIVSYCSLFFMGWVSIASALWVIYEIVSDTEKVKYITKTWALFFYAITIGIITTMLYDVPNNISGIHYFVYGLVGFSSYYLATLSYYYKNKDDEVVHDSLLALVGASIVVTLVSLLDWLILDKDMHIFFPFVISIIIAYIIFVRISQYQKDKKVDNLKKINLLNYAIYASAIVGLFEDIFRKDINKASCLYIIIAIGILIHYFRMSYDNKKVIIDISLPVFFGGFVVVGLNVILDLIG